MDALHGRRDEIFVNPEKLFRPIPPIRFKENHALIGDQLQINHSIPEPISAITVEPSTSGPSFSRQTIRCLFLILQRIDIGNRAQKNIHHIPEIGGDKGANSLRIFARGANLSFLAAAVDSGNILSFASLLTPNTASFRTGITWVDGQNPASAWLVPPPISVVGQLLKDLIEFLSKNIKDGCDIKVCQIFFYQFIHIHPLKDGNGRIARLWLMLFSITRGSTFGFAMALLALNSRRAFASIWSSNEDQHLFIKLVNYHIRSVDHLASVISKTLSEIGADSRLVSALVVYCACGRMDDLVFREELKCSSSLSKKIAYAMDKELLTNKSSKLRESIKSIEASIQNYLLNKEI